MPMVRAMRLLNAIEAGTTTGAQLETLLTDDPGRLAELNVLLGMRGQNERIFASATATAALIASPKALNALVTSVRGSKTMAANPDAMNAVIASSTAMNAVAASSTAMAAVNANDQAVRIWMLAGTNQVWSNFASVAAVAASSTAMNAVAASSTAMNAVAASSTAMNAVAASSTALAAIRQSSTALTAINASSTALNALYTAATKFNYAGGSWSANPATLVTGNYLLVRITTKGNPVGWGVGSLNEYIKIGGSLFSTTTAANNGTNNITAQSTNPYIQDNAARAVNNTSITYYLYNPCEIAYLAA